MKRCYVPKKFRKESLAIIERANQFIEQYEEQGIRITLRQLYYRFVGAALIPNNIRSYKNLGAIISDARLAGLISWYAIEDRVRSVERASEWEKIDDIVTAAIKQYRMPRRASQPEYVEVWCEKDALASILSPLCYEYHVPLMINRGYSSSSAMFESAQRIIRTANGRHSIILYFGDHDPSGEDMVRDVSDRLNVFRCRAGVEKVALTKTQVDEFNLPPNPAKLSDSRASGYIDKHGDESWELDALPPDELARIVRKAIEEHTDLDLLQEAVDKEEEDRKDVRERLGLEAESEDDDNEDDDE